MKPPPFEYEAPSSVEEALPLLGLDSTVLAGGQSLVPLLNLRLAQPELIVDINGIAELDYIRAEDGTLRIGAMTRQVTLERSELVKERWPLLSKAIGLVGHAQIRSRGTVGGSVAHADPAGDMPSVLLALGATFVATGPGGTREIAAGDMFPGLFQSALANDEVLTEIRVPKATGGWSYQKFTRRAQDWAVVGVAAVRMNGSANVSLTNMGLTPLRAGGVEEALAGGADPATAAERADEGSAPPSDSFGSEEYRRALSKVLVRRALEEALA
jgi:carbon-monoxide dehydrogenase medium subunit